MILIENDQDHDDDGGMKCDMARSSNSSRTDLNTPDARKRDERVATAAVESEAERDECTKRPHSDTRLYGELGNRDEEWRYAVIPGIGVGSRCCHDYSGVIGELNLDRGCPTASHLVKCHGQYRLEIRNEQSVMVNFETATG